MNYDTKYSESQINIQHFATLLYLLLFVSIICVYNGPNKNSLLIFDWPCIVPGGRHWGPQTLSHTWIRPSPPVQGAYTQEWDLGE